MNYQSKLIKDIIQTTLDNHLIDYSEDTDLYDLVVTKIGRIKYGENIGLIIIDGVFQDMTKLVSVEDTFTISSDSIIITYQELEGAFHDQIAV